MQHKAQFPRAEMMIFNHLFSLLNFVLIERRIKWTVGEKGNK